MNNLIGLGICWTLILMAFGIFWCRIFDINIDMDLFKMVTTVLAVLAALVFCLVVIAGTFWFAINGSFTGS